MLKITASGILLSFLLFSYVSADSPTLNGMNLILRSGTNYTPLLERLQSLGANTVALVVLCTQRGHVLDCGPIPPDQEIQTTITTAHTLGLSVILKPHIETSEFSWRGEIDFTTLSDRAMFFAEYEALLCRLADLHPDSLVIGTELMRLSPYASEWRQMIARLRPRFSGSIYYAAHFQEVNQVTWWDAVDAIGVDAYYPLVAPTVPTLDDLCAAWLPIRSDLAALSSKWNKPVIFFEIGYQSRVGSHLSPWQTDLAIPSHIAQARAYEAVFQTFSNESWFHGALWWDTNSPSLDWELSPHNSYGVGFSPLGKQAEQILSRYWLAAAINN